MEKRRIFDLLFALSAVFECCRIFPKKVELQALMRHYDVDGDGNISYEEFIRGLR